MSESNSILLEVIISIAVSVGGGTLLGYWLSERKEKARQEKEIKKIRSLLLADFERVNNLVIACARKVREAISKLETDEVSVNKLLSKEVTSYDFLMQYKTYLELVYWDALVSSGSLIKLEAREMQLIQAAYNYITDMQNWAQNLFENAEKTINATLSLTESEDERKKTLTNGLKRFLNELLARYTDLNTSFQILNEITWINLERM